MRLTADMLGDLILFEPEFTMQPCAHDALDGSRGLLHLLHDVDNLAEKHIISAQTATAGSWLIIA